MFSSNKCSEKPGTEVLYSPEQRRKAYGNKKKYYDKVNKLPPSDLLHKSYCVLNLDDCNFMKTKNIQPFRWNKRIAMELESIAHKNPENVPSEHAHILEKFDRFWDKMAKIIGYDFTDDTVINYIREYFPVLKNDPVFCLFDDAEEALAFFNDFRTIKAKKAIYSLNYSVQNYPSAIQGLIRFFVELVENSPVAFRDDPPLRLEAVLICIGNAISEGNITYNVLRDFFQIIHELEVYQHGYLTAIERIQNGKKRAEGKQSAVQRRLEFFNEFEAFCQQKAVDSNMPKNKMAQFFFDKKAIEEKNEEFALRWQNAETFYKSFCNRKQSPIKNKAREIKQKKAAAPYELSQNEVDILNDWKINKE